MSTTLEFSIPGDELEQHRIQLEHNLQQQQTDLSLHLSSEDHDDAESVEYPRHNSRPSPRLSRSFASFEYPSRTDMDMMDEPSAMHAWSYHDDDDDGVAPYAGETMSTAGHHASALTIGAGLAARGGNRRDISLSGAEYDPERPLQDIIAGVGGKLSGLHLDPSRSKMNSTLDFDPLVVDDSAELDQILRSGFKAPSPIRNLRSSPSSAGSDSDVSPSRPKLTDALQNIAFSPKRPRSRQLSPQVANPPLPSSLSQRPSSPLIRSDDPTPRPSRKKPMPNGIATHVQPRVEIHPPTPSTSAHSEFTRRAKGLAREIEGERSRWQDTAYADAAGEHYHPEPERSMVHSTVRDHKPEKSPSRKPFGDLLNQSPSGRARRQAAKANRSVLGKVHLPDVTGLTSAVASPMRGPGGYYGYDGQEGARDSEVRLLKILSNVQSQLVHLESENGISRRRVRELERELEVCKTEVAKERTRIMEHEREYNVRRQKDEKREQERQLKLQARERDEHEKNTRYKEAVEEKKALEALISTLRTHLTRLTSELSSHQALLAELHSLRDADHRALQEKAEEIERLRAEVERLAGEVEVLRGVVEEGLKERRERVQEREEDGQGGDSVDEDDEADARSVEGHVHERSRGSTHDGDDEDDEGNDYDQEQEPSQAVHDLTYMTVPSEANPISPAQGNLGSRLRDRTMRTDRATIASSSPSPGISANIPAPVDHDEAEQIAADLEERKLNRSMLSNGRGLRVADTSQLSINGASRSLGRRSPSLRDAASSRSPSPVPVASSSRPAAPTPGHAAGRHRPDALPERAETPFPQIRGDYLEQLFFSAPDHNEQTCTVCHRRQRRPASPATAPAGYWMLGKSRPYHDLSDDEEEQEDDQHGRDETRDKGEMPAQQPQSRGDDRLPPQTVLSRVLRELEDDFTHYKGIYVELADQYKVMDPASNVRKRNVLANHLREVVDILEQKGDQIASLYDLLSFKDKPTSESVVADKPQGSAPVRETASWGRNRGLRKHATLA